MKKIMMQSLITLLCLVSPFSGLGFGADNVLPSPTGPFSIGVTKMHLIDESREETFTLDPDDVRQLMIKIWYPTDADFSGKPSPYTDPLSADWLLKLFRSGDEEARIDIPDDFVNQVLTHAFYDAPLAGAVEQFPVLIFSPGAGLIYDLYTAVIEELASQGFIVVAINHPHISGNTVFPDGSVVELKLLDLLVQRPPSKVDVIADDAIFVLNSLNELNNSDSGTIWRDRFDFSRIGMLGHSIGGAGAAEVAVRDNRFLAVSNIDGTFSGEESSSKGVDVPLLFITSGNLDRRYRPYRLWQNSTSPLYFAKMEGSTHSTFTDICLLISFFDPDYAFTENECGTIDPHRGMKITTDYQLAFFNVSLNGVPTNVLTGLSSSYPEMNVNIKNVMD